MLADFRGRVAQWGTRYIKARPDRDADEVYGGVYFSEPSRKEKGNLRRVEAVTLRIGVYSSGFHSHEQLVIFKLGGAAGYRDGRNRIPNFERDQIVRAMGEYLGVGS